MIAPEDIGFARTLVDACDSQKEELAAPHAYRSDSRKFRWRVVALSFVGRANR
jgi:hypothetical protein